MANNHYCGNCIYFANEDVDGDGACDTSIPQTPVGCDTPACEDFTLKTETNDR